MEDPQQIVEWFRASTAYINAHRGKTFVVFLSGEALVDGKLRNLVFDLSLLHSLGIKLVLVHGARPQISAALNNAKAFRRALQSPQPCTPAKRASRKTKYLKGLKVLKHSKLIAQAGQSALSFELARPSRTFEVGL